MDPFIQGMLGIGVLTNGLLVEPASGGYTRQPFSITEMPSATGSLDDAANYGIPGSQWGSALTSWAMFDGGGNQIFEGNFATPINANAAQAAGLAVTILATAISLTFQAISL